jgi:hypothetical protein
MNVPRETIYAALWAKASGAIDPRTGTPAFITKSRRLRHWDDVAPDQQPALFMIQHEQTPQQVKGLPPKWDFRLSLFVYDNCGEASDAIPGQRLNYLLDAVDNALAPDFRGYQTLGGLVSHCWIEGTIEIFEGYKGMMNQSVAIIPVGIRVPDSSGPV